MDSAPSMTSVLDVPGRILVGSLFELGRDPLTLLLRGVDHDLTVFRFGPKAASLLDHPELLREVLVDDPDAYDKRTANNRVSRLVFGNSLVTSDGDYWKRQRRIAAPAFPNQRIRDFARTMRARSSGRCAGGTSCPTARPSTSTRRCSA